VFVFIVALLITGAFFLGKQERERSRSSNPFPRSIPHGMSGSSEADLTKAIKKDPKDPNLYIERAQYYAATGEDAKALKDLATALPLAKAPAYKSDTFILIRLYELRKDIHAREGDYQQVAVDMEGIVAVDPAHGYTTNNLAWLLATCPDAKVRNGKRAVELGKIACDHTKWSDSTTLDTLAAAYAETGDFVNAVKWQEKAKSLAPRHQRADFDSRLRLYKDHKPYREDPRGL
jgi:tetratricopeptide (TPR) repeat protein